MVIHQRWRTAQKEPSCLSMRITDLATALYLSLHRNRPPNKLSRVYHGVPKYSSQYPPLSQCFIRGTKNV